MQDCRFESLPRLYGSYQKNFSPRQPDQWSDAVLVQVPLVGEGNPATAMAITDRLRSNQIPTKLSVLQVSGIPAQAWHARMTRSADRSSHYTQTSESTRKGKLAALFGRVSKLEMEISLRQFFDSNPQPVVIGVQELQFLSFTAPQLLSRFLETFLYIPDVFPKESAVELLKRLPITALVWNEAARQHLEQQGISVTLVEPVLPFALAEAPANRSTVEPYVLVKSSGSGMPQELVAAITTLYRSKKIPFQLWLPDRIEQLEGSRPLPAARQDRIHAFYENLLHCPPALFIAYPSEMVQVLYALAQHNLAVPYLSLPPRGAHEHVNLNWGLKNHVITDKLQNTTQLSDLSEKLLGSTVPAIPQHPLTPLRDVIARARR